ncbi:MAG: hypothetical protein WBA99_09270 [Nodosilinea sp.]
MSTTPPNVLQLARQGDPDAIAALMNRHLEAQGITAHVVQQENTLQVNLEGAEIPSQVDLVAFIKKGITGLELAAVHHLIVSGKQAGATTSAWSENLVLQGTTDDFDLDFDAAPGDAIADDALASDSLDLDFDLDSPALDSSNFGDLDAALGNDISGADLDLDLGLPNSDLGLEAPSDLEFADSDFDLDLSNAGSGPEVAASDFDLDLNDASSDLEFADSFDLDLSDASSGSEFAENLDLGLSDDLTTDDNFDLDLGLFDESAPESSDLDFDLGPEATAESTADSGDLDFDLDLPDGPADSNVSTDSGFDFGFDDGPTTTAPTDAFDLGLDDGATDATADLNLSWVDEPTTDSSTEELDLDFGQMEEPAVGGAIAELDDLDLNGGLPETSPAGGTADSLALDASEDAFGVDLDFDLAETSVENAMTSELELDTVDFNAASDDAAFDTEIAGGEADLGTDFDAAFDTTVPAPPAEPDAEADLDDLWGDSSAAAAPESASVNQPADEDLMAFDAGLITDFDSPNEWGNLGSVINDDLSDEALEIEAGDADDIDFADLGLESDASSPESVYYPAATSSELIDADETPFEDLGAAADFDLATGDLDLADAPPNLSWDGYSSETDAEIDLSDTADLDLADVDGAESSSATVANTPFTDDLSPELLSAEALADTGDLGVGDFSDSDLDTDFGASWAESGADPDVVEAFSSDWEELTGDVDAGTEFDPGLVFDPADNTFDATPNPFEVEVVSPEDEVPHPFASPELEVAGDPGVSASDSTPEFDPAWEADSQETYTPGFEPEFDQEADADLPFSTMELDQTAAGNIVPDLDLDDSPSTLDAYDEASFVDQPLEDYATAESPVGPMSFDDGIDEDIAFESVEFEDSDFGSSRAETPGFSVGEYQGESDFAFPALDDEDLSNDAGFEDAGFSDAGFEDEGFSADVFSDSRDDSNGFIQDRNGIAAIDDEPDAADDFIQEFGSDPSTHVALTPDQFNDDSSVRRSGSSVPLRLIVGLGLGAVVLVLAGLLLNGVLGRLRSPGGDPVATESAVPDPVSLPTDPAVVPEDDLFRQAVNAAQTAANQAQTASTAAQWQEVADAWALSISLMERVPSSDPNYATAQQKAIDYQPNLDYAQQNAARSQ